MACVAVNSNSWTSHGRIITRMHLQFARKSAAVSLVLPALQYVVTFCRYCCRFTCISAVASSSRKPTTPWSICEWVHSIRIFVSSLSRCRVDHLCRIIRMLISHRPEVGPCSSLSPEHAFTYVSSLFYYLYSRSFHHTASSRLVHLFLLP